MAVISLKTYNSSMIRQQDTYKFCTNCKTELVDKDHFKECPKCKKQYFFNAKPTVALVLTNNKNEVLLTKRAHDPYKNWWDVTGGFVEPNETLEEAVQRELKEETGLSVSDLKYICSLPENYDFRGEIIPVVAAVFTGKAVDNETVVVADDVADYKFVPVDQVDVDTIAFDNQREVIRKILKNKISK
jgi:NAD+ diphosphatase